MMNTTVIDLLINFTYAPLVLLMLIPFCLFLTGDLREPGFTRGIRVHPSVRVDVPPLSCLSCGSWGL